MKTGLGVGEGGGVAGVGVALCHFAVFLRRDWTSGVFAAEWREGEVYWNQKWGSCPSL